MDGKPVHDRGREKTGAIPWPNGKPLSVAEMEKMHQAGAEMMQKPGCAARAEMERCREPGRASRGRVWSGIQSPRQPRLRPRNEASMEPSGHAVIEVGSRTRTIFDLVRVQHDEMAGVAPLVENGRERISVAFVRLSGPRREHRLRHGGVLGARHALAKA